LPPIVICPLANRALNHRRAHHALVENDRHEVVNVPRRLGAEATRPLVVHRELDDVAFRRRCIRLCVGEVLSSYDRLGVENVERAVDAIAERNGVAAPAENLPGRERRRHFRQGEVLIDRCNVGLRDIVLTGHPLPLLHELGKRAGPACGAQSGFRAVGFRAVCFL